MDKLAMKYASAMDIVTNIDKSYQAWFVILLHPNDRALLLTEAVSLANALFPYISLFSQC